MSTSTSTGTTAGPAAPTASAAVRLRPVPPGQARITGGVWHERAEVNRSATIPTGLEYLRKANNVRNLEIAAGTVEGSPQGPIFADSDVHKWVEAAAWEYGRSGGEDLLEAQLELTGFLARAQAEDGYLNSVVEVREGERYRKLPWSHEHYCAGHLIQAAVAQARTTGRRELLDVGTRIADHLVATFGPGKIEDVDGHPVIETALVELYRETGTREYLDLAQWFVEARGHGLIASHGHEPTYFSDRVPVREATTVEGHAVRAVYLAAGATDVAVETGDTELLEALRRQYDSMERSKQYLTGGLGSRWEGESFGDPYELPADRAYAETCAAIGGVQWAWRMLLATGEARYADQIERMLLNGMLAGVSLTGREFFYVNPLQLRSDANPEENRSPAHGRRGWFDCACCPPNVMRTLSSLAGYLATTGTASTGDAGPPSVQIHQYAAGTIAAAGLELDVETAYPWEGSVRVTVRNAPAAPVALALRVPAWADGATLDGDLVTAGEYASVTRTWAEGDAVTLDLPLTPRFTVADERVDAVRGCVALERGPLVYAVEAHDQPDGVVVDDVRADPSGEVTAEHREDLLGGVTVLHLQGYRGSPPPADALSPYAAAGARRAEPGEPVQLTAIPYYAWANRGPRPMRVWIPVARG
ncbi:glycoside hydrolase family 127 protein [Georgenia halophila]|uniref:Glycoside hydrolase family 127 protein n=1 Tax=Georgenia halophila TaxID=620889 RepID=A0ABP8LSU4_9MICO